MANRIEKVNSLLEREISKIILGGFEFPGDVITVTRVKTTLNLIESRVYISVMPEKDSEKIIRVLNKSIYDIQQKINKKLNMRPIPKVIFIKDEEIKEAARIEELIEKLKKEGK